VPGCHRCWRYTWTVQYLQSEASFEGIPEPHEGRENLKSDASETVVPSCTVLSSSHSLPAHLQPVQSRPLHSSLHHSPALAKCNASADEPVLSCLSCPVQYGPSGPLAMRISTAVQYHTVFAPSPSTTACLLHLPITSTTTTTTTTSTRPARDTHPSSRIAKHPSTQRANAGYRSPVAQSIGPPGCACSSQPFAASSGGRGACETPLLLLSRQVLRALGT